MTAFDQDELLARVDNDIAFLAETVDMLAADGPALLHQIRQAAAAGDAASVGRHAHALKGMISNFCAPAAQAAALNLEKIGKSGDLSAADAATDALQQHIDTLTRELTDFIKARA